MTIIEKLSDRGGFIYEAILLVLNNNPGIQVKELQWKLFQCGVYLKKPLMMQALSVMQEKKLISKPNEEKDQPTSEAAVQPQT